MKDSGSKLQAPGYAPGFPNNPELKNKIPDTVSPDHRTI
jgi:hypothetical protein